MTRLTRLTRLTTALAGAALLWAGVPGPAAPAAPSRAAAPPLAPAPASHTVTVTSTAEGLSAPAVTRPGLTTFHASTTAAGKGWVGLARLKDGKGWDDFLGALSGALSNTPAEVPPGAAELNRTATLLGGLVVQPGQPGSFTQRLRPGRYLLFDYLTAGETTPRYRWLTVTGAPVDQGLTPTATFVSKNVAGLGPRLEVRGTPRAGEPLRYVNEIPGQVNELLFVKIAEGTTEAGLRAYFDSLPEDGSLPPGSPFTSLSLGSLHLSTGRSSVVRLALDRDRYAVITWSKDATDGTRLVQKGLFTIVDLG
ncbi:hypothetical protein [Streptomyces sp. NPDC007088]|uniref:hypothetical protein n=1 Tax=Streptomyces sp. NPDC007088 TaxID=3364773 RepID=UPI0036D160A8